MTRFLFLASVISYKWNNNGFMLENILTGHATSFSKLLFIRALLKLLLDMKNY